MKRSEGRERSGHHTKGGGGDGEDAEGAADSATAAVKEPEVQKPNTIPRSIPSEEAV